MTLKERISTDYMKAFKAKDTVAKNLLSVIKGEIQTTEKNQLWNDLSDEFVLKILTKTRKSLEETRSKYPSDELNLEILIIDEYLPKQMSEDEVKDKVKELIESGCSNVGDIMKAFSSLPADRKLVAEIYNSLK